MIKPEKIQLFRRKVEEREKLPYVREKSSPLYHTNRWKRLSVAWRAEHPLCEMCRSKGKITPGEVLDHIVPVFMYNDFYDETNLQTLCKKCNAAKGNKDKRLINKMRNEQIKKNG